MKPSPAEVLVSVQWTRTPNLDISLGSGDWSETRTLNTSDHVTQHAILTFSAPGSRGRCDDTVPDALPHDGSWAAHT